MSWRKHALCKGRTNLMFAQTHVLQRVAKNLCEECKVSGPCAQEAFELAKHTDVYGMWGGTSKNYRERVVGKNRGVWGSNAK